MSSKLDRLVAERVMGYTFDPKEPIGELDKPTPRPLWLGPPKPYSSDISAAWEVVEKMRAIASEVEIHIHGHTSNFRQDHFVYIHGFNEDYWKDGLLDRDGDACGKSLPLAICLAALRAVGVPESEIQEALTP
jgi:hypothetical protein